MSTNNGRRQKRRGVQQQRSSVLLPLNAGYADKRATRVESVQEYMTMERVRAFIAANLVPREIRRNQRGKVQGVSGEAQEATKWKESLLIHYKWYYQGKE